MQWYQENIASVLNNTIGTVSSDDFDIHYKSVTMNYLRLRNKELSHLALISSTKENTINLSCIVLPVKNKSTLYTMILKRVFNNLENTEVW